MCINNTPFRIRKIQVLYVETQVNKTKLSFLTTCSHCVVLNLSTGNTHPKTYPASNNVFTRDARAEHQISSWNVGQDLLICCAPKHRTGQHTGVFICPRWWILCLPDILQHGNVMYYYTTWYFDSAFVLFHAYAHGVCGESIELWFGVT